MQNQSNNTNGSLIVRMCNVQKSLIAQEELMRQFSVFDNMLGQPYGMGMMPQSQMPMGGLYSAPMSATNGFDLNPEPPKATW